MRAFTALVAELERSRRRDAKLAALVAYFRAAAPADAAWAAFFLSGRKLGRPVTSRTLLEWAARLEGFPPWLAELSYEKVGDLAETAALLVRGDEHAPPRALADVVASTLAEPATEEVAVAAWRSLGSDERVVWNKLASGGFRPGVTGQLVARAIAEAAGVDSDAVAHRLERAWEPTPEGFAALVDPALEDTGESRPYPFASVEPLDGPADALGAPADWIAEWKWDGLRAQLVRRGGRTYLWSEGELVTERFPEVADAARALDDGTALDGVLVAVRDGNVLPSAELRRRDARAKPTKKVLQEAPAAFVAFDLLEEGGVDVRATPLAKRRAALELLLSRAPDAAVERLPLSPAIRFDAWEALDARRAEGRARGAEGLVLKRVGAAYGEDGAWRAWPVEPLGVRAVLIYVERGSAGAEYTFAVRDAGELVPVAKTREGVSDADARKLDHFARFHTVESFGPVRRVRPIQLFELAFDAVERAPRRKAGVTLRAPRVVAWLRGENPDTAASLADVRALLE